MDVEAAADVRRVGALTRATLLVFAGLTGLGVLTLFVLAADTDRYFAWTVRPPVTAAFLGAGYLAGLVLVVLGSRDPTWAHARLPVLTVLVFTVLTLGATLLHLGKFHFTRAGGMATFAAWVWTAVYVVVPALLVVVLVLQERAPGRDPAREHPLPAALRVLLAAQAVVLLGVGVVLYLVPARQAELWPWPLTPLTARAVASWLVALGGAAALAARAGDVEQLRIAALAYAVFGAGVLVAMIRFADTVAWGRPAAWVTTGVAASVAVTGAVGWAASRAVGRDVLAVRAA